MVTARVARGAALTAVVILIAVLAMLSGHQQFKEAEAVNQLTVGIDFKTAASNASTYTTLPAFEKCVDVKTNVNSGIFYIDIFVLNGTNLIATLEDLTFTSSKMTILEANGRQFFGTSTTVNTYGTNITNNALGTVSPGVSNGTFSVNLLDTGANHTGSGVLVRIKAQGLIVGGGSVVTLGFDLQPAVQRGVTLTDEAALHPGDTTNDGIFDGPYINSSGTIAIDRPDGDGDTVSDTCDNSPTVPNGPAQANIVGVGNQTDTDGDGVGDASDPDDDNDGILDGSDNCPRVYNPSQNASACADSDGDGVLDGNDNCPTTANSNQANNDGDSQGDLCDTDDDNDGILDGPDNCDFIANASQADWNSNGVGDACEDADGDGWTDSIDNCKSLANPSQTNTDNDNYGNLCDNCPNAPNNAQADFDNDLLGDYCDDSDTDTGTAFAIWLDYKELYMTTKPTVKCPTTSTRHDEGSPAQWNDAWPPDMDDNRIINGQDMLVFNFVLSKSVNATPVYVPGMSASASGPHPDLHRFDFSMNGIVNGQDLLYYNSILSTSCYTP